MSELITTHARANTRWNLLATVSALSLLGVAASGGAQAADRDADRPTLWVELGAGSSHLDGGQQPLAPPFLTSRPRPDFEAISPIDTQRLPRHGFDMDGKISLTPHGTDWVFTAAVRYGRSNGKKHVHQQTPGVLTVGGPLQVAVLGGLVSLPARFDDAKAFHNESHAVLDFMAGKDVGLGIFKGNVQSIVNFGVRFAQFHSKSGANIQSNPDVNITHHGTSIKYRAGDPHHTFFATQHDERSFRGIGPSIAWDASATVVGNSDDGGISFDWGVNAALLFGRQKTDLQHHTSGFYIHYQFTQPIKTPLYPPRAETPHRSRSVIVPNVGGFAGLSFRYPNAKVSFGYRADMFFGVIDGGIDARKTYDRAFYGPFASVSIGLGG